MSTTQDATVYTDEDAAVWAELFHRQERLLEGRVCPQFFDCVAALDLRADEIPQLESFSDRLEKHSGWRVAAADGQLSGTDYWTLIGDRKFPSVTSMRGRHELEHAALPDMFHDVFGHIPLLLDRTYNDYIHGMAEIALEHIGDEERMGRHGRVYKWTIEYGLIDQGAGPRVYGAGLISSSAEVDHALSDVPAREPFGVAGTMAAHHVPASLQERYFAIDSFQQLLDALPAVRRALEDGPTVAAS